SSTFGLSSLNGRCQLIPIIPSSVGRREAGDYERTSHPLQGTIESDPTCGGPASARIRASRPNRRVRDPGDGGPDRKKQHWTRRFEFSAGTRILMARPSHPGVIKMKILCAWCCREGQPGYRGELEPLENPQATHGICAQHKIQLLESLPSRSFPDAELLIVVRRNNPALYKRLKQSFAAMLAVKVILDGRVSERRAAPSRAPDDRRHHMKTRRTREGTISPDGNFTI